MHLPARKTAPARSSRTRRPPRCTRGATARRCEAPRWSRALRSSRGASDECSATWRSSSPPRPTSGVWPRRWSRRPRTRGRGSRRRARRGREHEDRGRLHVPRAVHRPRPHLRPGLEPSAPERPRRAARLPHAALRPRLALRARAGRPALPLPQRSTRSAARQRAGGLDLDGLASSRASASRTTRRPVRTCRATVRARPPGEPIFHARALIGDPRNDENLIVSQLHGVFLRFHNQMVIEVGKTPR